jgi:hypothetical protein
MSNAKHTPLPWGINKYGGIGAGEFFITPTIIESTGWSEDDCSIDQQFIVTAVNSHDELVAALEEIKQIVRLKENTEYIIQIADAVLTKVKIDERPPQSRKEKADEQQR